MGVKGLQSFVERCCPEACVTVNVREMARRRAVNSQQDGTSSSHSTSPTLVVDGMACLRNWYSCKDWVCGGQWREYLDVLKRWVEAFTTAGIRLVFFFDGVVKEQKRSEWAKRRRRVNGEISKIFRHIKFHREQPGRELFCLPSGLATFTSLALRSLGQEVFSSIQDADYEIASYARQHNCMGILGQDSDFIIYDSAPYLSVAKLRIDSLSTVMYDRHRLCQTIGLAATQLPLLACLLGNDVVSEGQMQHIRNEAMATYRKTNPASQFDAPQGHMVLAVAHLVSSVWSREKEETGLLPESLNLSASQREILKSGIRSYLLPGQEALQRGDLSALSSAPVFEKYVSPEILKASREKHVAVEGFMAYCVLCEGTNECSNTLEDQDDSELLPQALAYKSCRQHIYGLLLLHGHEAALTFQLSGNGLSTLETLCRNLTWSIQSQSASHVLNLPRSSLVSVCFGPGGQPSLDLLWFGRGPEVAALRLTSFFSIFDCAEFSELHGAVEDCLLAALCLVTYIVLQIKTLSEEDLDAYLSQAVCVRLKSPQELQQIKLPVLSSRAVQLGSLYVRGLSHLLGANCVSGSPLPSAALMPWHSFDGRLFHSKYLLAHSGAERTVLLDGDSSCLSQFLCLREKLIEACRKRGRIVQSRPRAPELSDDTTAGPSDRGGGETAGHGEGDRDRWERGGCRGGRGTRGGQHVHHRSYQHFHAGGPPNTSRPPHQNGGRSYRNRGRYNLAPRWLQPPEPGT